MPVTSVTEVFGERNGGINSNSEASYTRVFDVDTDSNYVGPKAVRTHASIPQLGDYYTNGITDPYDPDYEEDLGAFVNEVSADEKDNVGIAWKVVVKYGPGNTLELGGDPTLWKIRVRFGGERIDRVVLFDLDGNPIMNSAGDKFADPLTVDDGWSTMLITRNEYVSSFSLSLASTYSNSINNGTWNGFAARTCKLGIIETSDEQWDASTGQWYYTVTYPVKINPDTWVKRLLDQGFNELDDAGSTKPIMYQGQQVSEARPLDGAGHALDGTDGYDTPTWLDFRVEKEVDWTGLNINLALRLQ